MYHKSKYYHTIYTHGRDIIKSPGMSLAKRHIQHGNVSVYKHSLSVACRCLQIADFMHLKIDTSALVRGSLLHDYFLYDWHIRDKNHKWHGFTHAALALQNAQRDFNLNEIEKNMIARHMFPLNRKPPKYRESIILCIADKLCAISEIIF